MIVIRRVRTPPLQVPVESGARRVVQGHEPALTEFGTADHEAVWRDVVESESDGFRHPQPRAGQEREPRAVRLSPQGPVPRLGGGLNQLPNLIGRQNVRHRARWLFSTKDGWRDLMPIVFGAEIACE